MKLTQEQYDNSLHILNEELRQLAIGGWYEHYVMPPYYALAYIMKE